MIHKVEYIISTNQDGNNITKQKIIPVDSFNTGIIQYNTQLTNIQQFLEIKERLEVNSPSLVTVFMSYLEFLKRYDGNIFGMSGTLGSENTRVIYKYLYNMESFNIPRYNKSLFKQMPPVIAQDTESWKNYIVQKAITISETQQ